LEDLGFWGENLANVQAALTSPHGLIVVAGPKRSGKTTTLHSLLELLNTPMVSIATIEERTVRRIPGASQARVDHTQPHASALANLQAVLRQDPNVIMLGRMTDSPTAKLAVHSALSGHMVLAGLLSDGAVSGLLHIRSLGVEPFLLATAARVAIGQRLVRRLCPQCRERYELDDPQRKELERAFDISSAKAYERIHALEQAARDSGMGNGPPGSSAAHITHLYRAGKSGCEACEHTGYQGYIALTEVLALSEPIQNCLAAIDPLTPQKLHAAAIKAGFVPLALDGLIKSLRGETPLAEVLRAVN
jgi:type II secretory ATPase GspE/PulE/Tfp pilus assembly ATPase PilB-like protein